MASIFTGGKMTSRLSHGINPDMGILQDALEKIDAIAKKDFKNRTGLAAHLGVEPNLISRWYAEDEKNRRTPKMETIAPILDRLGFKLISPDEHQAPTICDMGDYALIPKVKAKLGAGSSLVTDGEQAGLYAFRKDFLRRIGLDGNGELALFDVMGDSMAPTIQPKHQ